MFHYVQRLPPIFRKIRQVRTVHMHDMYCKAKGRSLLRANYIPRTKVPGGGGGYYGLVVVLSLRPQTLHRSHNIT